MPICRVKVGLVVLALQLGAGQRLGLRRVAGADHQVGAVRRCTSVEQARHLGGRVLAVASSRPGA